MKLLVSILLLFLCICANAQVIDPFSIRFQTSQKGSIRFVSNASVTCNGTGSSCTNAKNENPPGGTSTNNGYTMSYIDIDGDASTFMSSSDSLNLPTCSSILWAGLYWNAIITSGTSQYSNRNQVKLKVNNGRCWPI